MTIAIYAGSFNPFHKGHMDILLKANAIFDKVIVARGVNPDKPKSEFEIPKQVNNIASVMEYSGLLTEFIKSIQSIFPDDRIILVRGLRNSTDFEFELMQYRYIEQLMPEIKMVSLICDKQYDHVSSSGIRSLLKFDNKSVKQYLI